MRTTTSLLFAFQLFASTNAAGCQKDACYNAVAVRNNQAGRNRADCKSIVRSGGYQQRTTTMVSTVTADPGTTTTSTTGTSTFYVATVTQYNKRDEIALDDISPLEKRANYAILGNKPAYASACRKNTDYASACACWDAVGPQQVITKTATSTSTIYPEPAATVTGTSTIVQTGTSTQIITRPTGCSSQQRSDCGQSCFCLISYDKSTRICAPYAYCPNTASASNPACRSDADCKSQQSIGYDACVWDSLYLCRGGTVCAYVKPSNSNCPGPAANPLRKRALREIERVMQARSDAVVMEKIEAGTFYRVDNTGA